MHGQARFVPFYVRAPVSFRVWSAVLSSRVLLARRHTKASWLSSGARGLKLVGVDTKAKRVLDDVNTVEGTCGWETQVLFVARCT
jgi:hypothetical protein